MGGWVLDGARAGLIAARAAGSQRWFDAEKPADV